MEISRQLSQRYGFESKGMQLLGAILSPFFRCKCRIPKQIAELDEPVVFVCNHYEIFGPFAVILSLPLKCRYWVNSFVAEASAYIDHLVIGTQHALPFLSERAARKLLEKVAPIVERVLSKFRLIPVYHENLGKQMRSIQSSVDAMIENDHIVLFPETAIPAYSHGSVTEFFRSFALIGEYYRRKTGKSALFCPIYVDKKHRCLQFGDLVRYGNEKAAVECERIVQELRSQLLSMAEAACGHPSCPSKVV